MLEYSPENCDVIFVKGRGFNHCAIVHLDRVNWWDFWIHEAWPKTGVHKMPFGKWLDRWDQGVFRWTGAAFTVYRRTPMLTEQKQELMHAEAIWRHGIPYNWALNYLFKLAGYDDCTEYIGRQMIEAGVTEFPCEPSRIGPRMLKRVLIDCGCWRLLEIVKGSRRHVDSSSDVGGEPEFGR